ncbi:MAG: hypothetical protein ACM3O7_00465 [Acidobacteriota bacterium]
MRAVTAAAALALGSLALSACTSVVRTADRDFSQGKYAAASAGYQSALAGTLSPADQARALYRLGLLCALPGSDEYAPALARQRFNLLLERFPGSPYTLPARAMLALQDAADVAAARAATLEAEVSRLQGEAKLSESAAQAREAAIAHLRAGLADAEAQLKRVRSELEQLKAIDLRRRP